MGSYRRGQADCGDIDIIITRDTSDGKDHRGIIKQLCVLLSEQNVLRYELSTPDDWDAVDAK